MVIEEALGSILVRLGPEWINYTWRLVILGANGFGPNEIHVSSFGTPDVLDKDYSGVYSPDTLPDWMQERLAVLMMTPVEFPTVEIPTVGRRISGTVFWVYAPK